MKKALFTLFFFGALAPVSAQTFTDVTESHSSYAAIESLSNLAIINGYGDGSFGPNNPVTRAEATKMILVSANKPAEEGEAGFADIPQSAWFSPFILAAKNLGIVKGHGNTGEFRPNNQVTRAEFVKMTLTAFGKDTSKHTNVPSLGPDVNPGDWHLAYMSYAKTIGLVTPSPNGSLFPNTPLNRAECADILYRMIVIERGGETQKQLNIVESKLVSILVNLNNNDVENALADANTAVAAANAALAESPNENLVKAVHSIALGFQELCLGYKAGTEGDSDALNRHANTAKDYAGKAFDYDNSTQPIGKQIKAQADVLLGQMNQ